MEISRWLLLMAAAWLFAGPLLGAAPGPVPPAAPEPALAEAPYAMAVKAGDLTSPGLTECSGLAASRRREGVFWALNDSGNPAVLYALGADGRPLGQVAVSGAVNVDWEDLASYRSADGVNWLVIGDTGDNNSRRENVVLYFVKEPVVPEGGLAAGKSVAVSRKVTVRYEDGPRDCESLAVDAASGEVYLLSKRAKPPALYLVGPSVSGKAVARKLVEVPSIPQGDAGDNIVSLFSARLSKYLGQPTAMDFAADGSAAVVLTYLQAYRFPRARGESWAVAFSHPPQQVRMPLLRQGEAVCFDGAGKSIFIAGEQLPAPLLRADPESAQTKAGIPGER